MNHCMRVPFRERGGVARRAPGQGLLPVSTMKRTNESLESPHTLANYMIMRCATVGFNSMALCRGCIWACLLAGWLATCCCGSEEVAVCAPLGEAVDSFSLPRKSALPFSPHFVFRMAFRGLARCLISNFCLGAEFVLDIVRPRLHRAVATAWCAVYRKDPLSFASN